MVPSILSKTNQTFLPLKRGTLFYKIWAIYHNRLQSAFIFLIWPLLETRVESFASFLEEVKTPKFPFEIYRPLTLTLFCRARDLFGLKKPNGLKYKYIIYDVYLFIWKINVPVFLFSTLRNLDIIDFYPWNEWIWLLNWVEIHVSLIIVSHNFQIKKDRNAKFFFECKISKLSKMNPVWFDQCFYRQNVEAL